MEMEFYNLYNTLSSYKRSIIKILDQIDEGILAAVNRFENPSGLKMSAKKYNLSLEMMKILQNYLKILFLTEATAEEFLSKQHDRDYERDSDCRSNSNPFSCSSFTNATLEHVLCDTELNFKDFTLDEVPSKLPSNIISDTETLVDLTNKLIESEFGSATCSTSSGSRTLVPEDEASDVDNESKLLSTEIKIKPELNISEENSCSNCFENDFDATHFENDKEMKNIMNDKESMQNLLSKTTTKPSPSENGCSKIPVKSPSEVKKISVKLSCRTTAPVKKNSTNPPIKSPAARFNNHSVQGSAVKPPESPENITSSKPPSVFPKVSVKLPKSNNSPKMMKPAHPESVIPPSNENVEVKSPKPENTDQEQPQIDVKPKNTEVKPPPEPSTTVKTPEPPVSVKTPEPPITVETPEQINEPNRVATTTSEVHYSTENKRKTPPPSSADHKNTALAVKTPEPPIRVKTPEQINEHNRIAATTNEVHCSAENKRKPSPPSSTDCKYTALVKLLNMTVHDRKKEAEKRYEGKHVIKNFKWKTVTKSSTSSDRKTKEKCVILYELEDDVLEMGQLCNFSYIDNPGEFYVRTNQELFEKVENSMNEDLNSMYQYVVGNYQSKSEARATLGNYCFVFLAERRRWYRVQVLDWLDHESERILVQLVDYGEKYYCRYKNMKQMMELYAEFPKMAIRCHLAHVRSLEPSGKLWGQASIDALVELSEMQQRSKFVAIYAAKEGRSYAVDLMKEDGEKTLGEVLVECELAAASEPVAAFGPPELLAIDEESDDELDFDNINEAVAGYDAKDEARICPFTDESGGCFKGPACKLDHEKLSADGITTDKVLSVTQTVEPFVMPAEGESIEIRVTGYINTCHFYAHIVKDRASPEQIYNREFQQLMDNMNASNLVKTYEPLKIYPGLGELILLNYKGEWRRARCQGYSGKLIECFLVDFGMKWQATMADIRQMKEDFLYLPFQAVECMLDSWCEKREADSEASLAFYFRFMHHRTFKSLVVGVDGDLLRLRMWDGNDMEMGYVLHQWGLGQERSSNFFPDKNSILSCA